MDYPNQPVLKSLEGFEGKVIPYELFCKCRGEIDARKRISFERRSRLIKHYTHPTENPEERKAQSIKHYIDPI